MVAEIDQIAEMCRSKLCSAVPDHPAVSAPLVPSSEMLPDSKWNRERCQQLFRCINDVLYNQVSTLFLFLAFDVYPGSCGDHVS